MVSSTGNRVAFLVIVLLLAAAPAWADTFTYGAMDHPDGTKNPPPYGLRLDVGGVVHTFHFSNVLFTYDDSTGMATLGGDIVHNQPEAGENATYSILATFQFKEFQGTSFFDGGDPIADLINNGVNGDRIVFDMVHLELFGGDSYNDEGPLVWVGKANGTGEQFMIEKGHRGVLVAGYGWLMPEGGSGQLGTNDFIFKLVPVPEPGTLPLLGGGLAALGLLRRRRAMPN